MMNGNLEKPQKFYRTLLLNLEKPQKFYRTLLFSPIKGYREIYTFSTKLHSSNKLKGRLTPPSTLPNFIKRRLHPSI